ncbi:hypothetical protein D3C85_1422650 [compost metagenome]
MAEQVGLDDLQAEGDRADAGAQQDAGQEAGEPVQRAGQAGAGMGGVMGGRHGAHHLRRDLIDPTDSSGLNDH